MVDWDELYEGGVGSQHLVELYTESTPIEVMDVTIPEVDSYGYSYEEGGISLVFKNLNTEKFYKKSGYQSSYSDVRHWDGALVEVFPKTRIVYDFKE